MRKSDPRKGALDPVAAIDPRGDGRLGVDELEENDGRGDEQEAVHQVAARGVGDLGPEPVA